MADAPKLLPAITLQVQMQGLAALGLDVETLRAVVGPVPEAPDLLVSNDQYEAMWACAHGLYGKPGLPSALAMAIPFGAFGALDYLVGSADTIGGCVASAQMHFGMVASDVWLESDAPDAGTASLSVRAEPGLSAVAVEFTLACVWSRLRFMSRGKFSAVRVALPLTLSADESVREQVYGCALLGDHPCAELLFDADHLELECASADPYLHETLSRMAAQLHLSQSSRSPLERALRMRLRGALATGSAKPSLLARLIGISERTLQRRLSEIGRSFSEVLDDFRREEATRLLHDASMPLVEVASRLGYAEQTSFTRAFRRWTGTTPNSWRTAQSAGS